MASCMGDRETPGHLDSTALSSRTMSAPGSEADPGIPESSRFELVRMVGAGGMGVVYEAHDRQLDMRVALKTLKRYSGALLLRFKNEFRALADLHHRNLVQLYELFQEGTHWFFSMELVGGVDFITYVWKDAAKLRAAAAELAEGLVALHRAHKVHCDIKPSNVLVEPGGRVVLLDFGLVSELDDEGAPTRQVGGTPAYMAPEQAAGAPIGPESDWYAVGVMLYQALTGEMPPHSQPPPASTRAPDVPADLDALCAALLRRDPGERPRGDEVLARLGVSARPESVEVPFVGRRSELAELSKAYARVREGRTVAVVIEGESGLGKSALAARFTDALAAAGAVVLAGRCYERESVPYKAFDGVIDALTHALAALPGEQARALLPPDAALLVEAFPVLQSVGPLAALRAGELGPPDPGQRRHRLFSAMRFLLTSLAQRRGPVVIAIDDLQWSDADSLALLSELARGSSLLLVMTSRPGARPLELSCELRRLELARLSGEDARTLAHELLAGHADGAAADAASLAEEAGGHPLFIAELVQHARAHRPGGVTLDDALGARIAELDRGRVTLLELLAVAGGPLEQDALAQAAEQTSAAYTRHVAELRMAQLLRTDGARIVMYHDRVRAAVERRVDAEGLRRCHERLALTLETRPQVDPEALLVHFRGAGQLTRAAQHAVAAAEQAQAALAFERAARLYRTALELDRGRSDAALLQERLGDALASLGHQVDAADAYVAAAGHEHGTRALHLKRRAAELYMFIARPERGQVILDEVLAAVGLRLQPTAARALLTALWLRVRLGLRGLRFTLRAEKDVPRALLDKVDVCRSTAVGHMGANLWAAFEFHTRRLLLALDAGEPARLSEAITTEVGIAAISGPLGRRRVARLLGIASDLAAHLDRPLSNARLVVAQGTLAFYEGRWKDSQAKLERAEQMLRDHCVGAIMELQIIGLSTFCTRLYLGDLRSLRERLPGILQQAEERDEPLAKVWYRSGFSPVVLLADDALAEARQRLALAQTMYAPSQTMYYCGVELYAHVTLELYAGDGAAAWRELSARWKALQGTHELRQKWLYVLFWELRGRAALAAAAADGAGRARLVREARRAARRVESQGMPWGVPFAQLLRAGVAALQGDPARATSLRADAARGFAACDMTMHAAVAQRGGASGDWFEAQKIRDPERFARMLAPIP